MNLFDSIRKNWSQLLSTISSLRSWLIITILFLVVSVVYFLSVGSQSHRVALVVGTLNNEFHDDLFLGFATKLSERLPHAELILSPADDEEDINGQVETLERELSGTIDALAIAPLHRKILVGPIVRIMEKGIPVVLVDTKLDTERTEIWTRPRGIPSHITSFCSDNKKIGEVAAQELLKVLKERATGLAGNYHVYLLQGVAGESSAEERESGFQREFELLKTNYLPNGLTVEIRKLRGNFKLADAQNLIEALPASDLKRTIGVYACNDKMAIGAHQAFRDIAMFGDTSGLLPVIIGTDGTREAKAFFKPTSKGLYGSISQNPAGMGEAAADYLADRIEKKTSTVTFKDAPQLVTYSQSKTADRNSDRAEHSTINMLHAYLRGVFQDTRKVREICAWNALWFLLSFVLSSIGSKYKKSWIRNELEVYGKNDTRTAITQRSWEKWSKIEALLLGSSVAIVSFLQTLLLLSPLLKPSAKNLFSVALIVVMLSFIVCFGVALLHMATVRCDIKEREFQKQISPRSSRLVSATTLMCAFVLVLIGWFAP